VQSVSRFLRALFKEGNPQDALALYTFNWETVQRTGYMQRADPIERELKGFQSGGGTSLYDAIRFGAQSLQDRDGRHVLVLVTDGGDTTSASNFHQALEEAQRADAVIYPILVMPITNDAGRNIGGENALTTMAQRTGGKVFAPTLGDALDSAFSEILRDLRTQYLLGFYPRNVPPSDDPFHRLEIKVRRPDLRVSSRSGYYGDAVQASQPQRPPQGWRKVR
jgi:Ca-activated chloride channel family protein